MFLLNILHIFCCFSELNHTYTPKTPKRCNLIHIKGGIYAGYLGKQIFVPGKMCSDHVKMFSHSVHHINRSISSVACAWLMTPWSTLCALWGVSVYGSSHIWQRVSSHKCSASSWQKNFTDTVFKICGRPVHFPLSFYFYKICVFVVTLME